jgi:hypothetical protein
MNPTIPSTIKSSGHQGPPLGILAIVYGVLFIGGLYFVCARPGGWHFPGPWESSDTIIAFFQNHSPAVQWCAFLQFGAAIPLGIYAATAVSRLQFLGVRAAGTYIALFGGFMAVFNMAASALILWVMAFPGIAQDPAVLRALYYLAFAFGGPGFSIPFGLLIAGICIPAVFIKALPTWMVIFGMFVAVMGELSWFDLITPRALMFIPLTRFPGFIWLILAGFMLPVSRAQRPENSVRKIELSHSEPSTPIEA